jgi:hypothetical protein
MNHDIWFALSIAVALAAAWYTGYLVGRSSRGRKD